MVWEGGVLPFSPIPFDVVALHDGLQATVSWATALEPEVENHGRLELTLLWLWLRLAGILGIATAVLLGWIAYRAKLQRELPLIFVVLALLAAGWCFWMSVGLIPGR